MLTILSFVNIYIYIYIHINQLFTTSKVGSNNKKLYMPGNSTNNTDKLTQIICSSNCFISTVELPIYKFSLHCFK